MEEKHYLEELSDDLALKLGRAVWNFAKIEWLTYEYISHLCNDDILSLVGDQNFDPRLNILKKLITKSNATEKQKETAMSLIKEASTLASDRNTIIHNPWQVYVDMDKMDFVSRIFKYTNQEHDFNVDDVVVFSKKAEKIEKELKAALQALNS